MRWLMLPLVMALLCLALPVASSEQDNPDRVGNGQQQDSASPYVYEAPPTEEERRAQLGRAGWTLLHTMAAKYHPVQREEMAAFLTLFAKLYPCELCAGHLQAKLATNPPDLTSGDAFVQWMCRLHNSVNLDLGKPEFDCSRVGDRWDCGCRLMMPTAAPAAKAG